VNSVLESQGLSFFSFPCESSRTNIRPKIGRVAHDDVPRSSRGAAIPLSWPGSPIFRGCFRPSKLLLRAVRARRIPPRHVFYPLSIASRFSSTCSAVPLFVAIPWFPYWVASPTVRIFVTSSLCAALVVYSFSNSRLLSLFPVVAPFTVKPIALVFQLQGYTITKPRLWTCTT
jgi:hypothetical protein